MLQMLLTDNGVILTRVRLCCWLWVQTFPYRHRMRLESLLCFITAYDLIILQYRQVCVTLTFAERFRLVFSLSSFANLSTKITTKREFRLSLSFLLSENT